MFQEDKKEDHFDNDGSHVAWWIQITAGIALLLMSLYQVIGKQT